MSNVYSLTMKDISLHDAIINVCSELTIPLHLIRPRIGVHRDLPLIIFIHIRDLSLIMGWEGPRLYRGVMTSWTTFIEGVMKLSSHLVGGS